MTASGSGGRRRRQLDAEEKALWRHVTGSVKRLRPQRELPPEPPPPVEEPAPPAAPAPPTAAVPAVISRKPPDIPAPPPLAPIEPKLRRRLGRGQEVDARLDLHGLSQSLAHGRLNAFLRGAQGAGHGVVLVITGKGDASKRDASAAVLAGEGGRGVLRRLVPQWLAAPELRAIVLGFEEAARGHGGAGALYVRIRRRKTPTEGARR